VSIERTPMTVTINGKQYGPIPVANGMFMHDWLTEELGLTGCRLGCGIGICHACVAILDNPDGTSLEIQTCITPAHYFDGKKIRTVEGIAESDADGKLVALSPVQQKFVEHYSFQCGYCTPGFVNAATVLIEQLKREPVAREQVEETILSALDPHICRCTGYVRYYQAVKDVILSTPALTKGA
jgi:aerobic-type carbon monoxide dehydrogenase small subunit (CoxS/CutS family)